jgi:hypothetical protein
MQVEKVISLPAGRQVEKLIKVKPVSSSTKKRSLTKTKDHHSRFRGAGV